MPVLPNHLTNIHNTHTQTYFPMPGPAAFPQDDQPWYSFKWGALHFTVMSTEHGACVRA